MLIGMSNFKANIQWVMLREKQFKFQLIKSFFFLLELLVLKVNIRKHSVIQRYTKQP